MNRPSLSWLERHVEKVVLGFTGSVLLATVLFYGIRSPYTINVAGERLGPSELNGALAEKANAVRLAMKDAPPPKLASVPDFSWFNSVPAAPAPPFVPLGYPIPKVTVPDLAKLGHVRLAAILPPTQPVVSTGKAAARIPDPVEIPAITATARAAQPEFVITRDCHWVTLAAAISRQAQREVFLKAKYDPRLLDLVVADIEAERQLRLPDGKWDHPVLVKPYAPLRRTGPRTIRLLKDEAGYGITSADYDYLRAYGGYLSHPDVQAQILRVPFQSYLADENPANDDRMEWTVPSTLKAADGVVLDLSDPSYGLIRPDDGSRLVINPRTDGPIGLAQMKRIKDILDTGWKDAGLNAYSDAVSVLRSIETSPNDSTMVRRMAERLLDEHDSEIRVADQLYQAARESQPLGADLGPDVEPIWGTDTTVTPGETYRYRLRLLAFSGYAGRPVLLDDPLEAGKVLIEGEWSPWSEPIAVGPDRYLFVLDTVDEVEKQIRVQLYQWSNGLWHNGSATVTIGDSLSIRSDFTDLTYDGVVRAIDFHRPYQEPGVSSNRTAGTTSSETVAVTLVTAGGEAEEHLAAVDRKARAALIKEIKEEERRRRSVDELSRTVLTRGRETSLRRDLGSAVGDR
ncbi:MAG TPA: hypothetical protein PKY77_21010 [Phycisphaerae bacterium]|nr:hypothetical protein [Phycisphaerae bacterium]HRY69112.1 hypothetical protein [Phycisphaerae bacterium]HSA29458.1 hypothetical protein [Phycisphaerae bacterium]